MDAVCIECIEQQDVHKHRNNFRGLKKFYESLAEKIDELQKELHDKNQDNKEWFISTADKF